MKTKHSLSLWRKTDASSYNVDITVTDQGTLAYTESITINLIDVNEAPTEIALSDSKLNENSAIATEVGTLSATDQDANQTFTYAIAENENFELAGDKIVTKRIFDFEVNDSSYSVDITVTDQGDLAYTESITINLVDINEAPTAIALSNSNIDENAVIGTTVGTLSATDQDENQTFTYAMAENEDFELAGDKIVTKRIFDFEKDASSYNVDITVTDQGTLAYTESITINLVDINEAPTAIALSNSNIDENAVIGTTVGTLSATDQDENQTFTYAMAENENFELAGDKIVTKRKFDFETDASSYNVDITVTDQGALAYTESITINLVDINEAPTAIALSNSNIDEKKAIATEVGTLSATDQDDKQTFTYAIAENENFELAGDKIITKRIFDFETDASSYNVDITVTDQGGLAYTESITINIVDINEAPTEIALSNSNIDENAAIGTSVGTLSATDEDINQSFTCTMVENKNFEMADDKIITKKMFNFEIDASSYEVEICFIDQGNLSYTKTITINLIDVNEAPTQIMLSNNRINEDAEIDSLIGTLSTIDEDSNDEFFFEIEENEIFQIVENKLLLKKKLNLKNNGYHVIDIKVIDNAGLTYTQGFEIIVDISTGIIELKNIETKLHPNPVEDNLNIQISGLENEDVHISIYSLSGDTLFKQKYQVENGQLIEEINMHNFSSGTYLMMLVQNKIIKSYKIIKL